LPAKTTRFWTMLGLLVLVGLVVRLVFVRAFVSTNLHFDDGLWYHTQANLLADGKGFIDPLAYVFQSRVRESAGHPPLWVVVLGTVSWFGGTSAYAHQITQVVVAALAVGTVGLLGREIVGDRGGLIAAGVAALYPPFWGSQGDVYSESLYTVVIALMLLFAYRLLRRPTWPNAAALGFTATLAAFTRGEALLFLPFLVLPVTLCAPADRRTKLGLVGAAALAALVLLAPWTIYNATRFDDPVLVTTGLGPVVAGANCTRTYAGDEIGSWNVQCSVHKMPGDESVVSRELQKIGTTYAQDHLGRAPVVAAARVGRTLEVFDVDPNTLGPEWVRWLMAAAWYALIPVAIAGVVALRRRRIAMLPLVATIVTVVVAVALTWGTPRFRVPIDVAVIVLAAAAVDTWWPRRAPDPGIEPATPERVPG
jgi:4-amino-4-deoxy-L-arabinose transferase-like glycosyltransferase